MTVVRENQTFQDNSMNAPLKTQINLRKKLYGNGLLRAVTPGLNLTKRFTHISLKL